MRIFCHSGKLRLLLTNECDICLNIPENDFRQAPRKITDEKTSASQTYRPPAPAEWSGNEAVKGIIRVFFKKFLSYFVEKVDKVD